MREPRAVLVCAGPSRANCNATGVGADEMRDMLPRAYVRGRIASYAMAQLSLLAKAVANEIGGSLPDGQRTMARRAVDAARHLPSRAEVLD
jgi:hypothetical protein